eukprot:996381-Amorphochlora_amoeboformis.AAC.1
MITSGAIHNGEPATVLFAYTSANTQRLTLGYCLSGYHEVRLLNYQLTTTLSGAGDWNSNWVCGR